MQERLWWCGALSVNSCSGGRTANLSVLSLSSVPLTIILRAMLGQTPSGLSVLPMGIRGSDPSLALSSLHRQVEQCRSCLGRKASYYLGEGEYIAMLLLVLLALCSYRFQFLARRPEPERFKTLEDLWRAPRTHSHGRPTTSASSLRPLWRKGAAHYAYDMG